MGLISSIYGQKIGRKADRKSKWKRRALRAEALLREREKRSFERASFYDSPAWQRLRYEALKRSNGKCELCGSGKSQGSVLHVDHIKPRSRFPHLELELSNLQVLCKPCNMGKGARDDTDWRDKRLRVVGGTDRAEP